MSTGQYPLRLYLKRWPILVFGLIALGVNCLAWLWVILQVPRSGQMVLHYTVLFGVDRLGAYSNIFYVPLLGFVIIVVNLALGWRLYQRERFLSELLVFVGCLSQLAVFFFSYLMVLLNG